MTTKAIYPGTFDPVTRGHLDVIERAGRIFDELTAAVGSNPAKKALFSLKERAAMLRRETRRFANVKVCDFRGLLVDLARKRGTNVILRGVRSVADFEYELQMAVTNRSCSGVETIFMAPRAEYAFITAQLLREIASEGGDVSSMVTPDVEARLRSKFRRRPTRTGRKRKGGRA